MPSDMTTEEQQVTLQRGLASMALYCGLAADLPLDSMRAAVEAQPDSRHRSKTLELMDAVIAMRRVFMSVTPADLGMVQ